ncbi:hypothetical protein QJS10_CPA10g01513 [Acorus calamus]|uniref:Reverse transcriptase zinc-binding domain-containing protein n=1 Tax=Acorus calamus TaxID=4465 RepID=A0AAV9DZT7_ACOCL|nr:hypothetical protein QJS10_CPA10g01513 [Acorus calamus]
MLPFLKLRNLSSSYKWWRRNTTTNVLTAGKWREIWRIKIPLKAKFFLWLMYQDKLLTRGYRAKWAPLADASCLMCREELETSNHLMLHCPAITQIWNRLAAASDVVFALTSMEDLWRSGKRRSDKRDKSAKAKIFQILIPAVAWSYWLSRNHLVFRGTPGYVENIWESVVSFIRSWGTLCAGAKSVNLVRERSVKGLWVFERLRTISICNPAYKFLGRVICALIRDAYVSFKEVHALLKKSYSSLKNGPPNGWWTSMDKAMVRRATTVGWARPTDFDRAFIHSHPCATPFNHTRSFGKGRVDNS